MTTDIYKKAGDIAEATKSATERIRTYVAVLTQRHTSPLTLKAPLAGH